MSLVEPTAIARKYLAELKESVRQLDIRPHIIGFIATDDPPSVSYAKATRRVFTEAGFSYDLRQVKRLELESGILKANDDPDVHGIFIYFPIFNNQEDTYLRNLVHYTKDIEAGSLYWTRKLSTNDRLAIPGTSDKKALLPCTPLAIVKILDDIGEYGPGKEPLAGKTAAIFNRSEVIGRPLAVMLSNDGALVHSFDLHGPLEFRHALPSEVNISRAEALAAADLVITGVPDGDFKKLGKSEISKDAVCVNFSSCENFTDDIAEHVRIFVPRVGPMTVAMSMRNTIRLYENFHS